MPQLFYRYGAETCLEIEAKSVMFGAQAPGLADTHLAEGVDARHRTWAQQFPEDPGELWDILAGFDTDSRDALFAHCVSLTVNAIHEAYQPAAEGEAHAAQLAEILSLNLVDGRAGYRRSRIISAVSPKRASSRPFAKPRVEMLRSASSIEEGRNGGRSRAAA